MWLSKDWKSYEGKNAKEIGVLTRRILHKLQFIPLKDEPSNLLDEENWYLAGTQYLTLNLWTFILVSSDTMPRGPVSSTTRSLDNQNSEWLRYVGKVSLGASCITFLTYSRGPEAKGLGSLIRSSSPDLVLANIYMKNAKVRKEKGAGCSNQI